MTRLASLLLGAATFAFLLAQPAAAQPGEVQGRANNQQNRIDQGVASGQLSAGEAARDQAHLNNIEAAKARDKAMHGGHLTPAEHARLNQRLNNNSARVYDTKHNAVTAPR